RTDLSLACFARLPLDVFHYAAALIEVRKNPRSANLCEFRGLGRNGVFGLFFKVRKMKIFVDQLCVFIDISFGLVVFLAWLTAGNRSLTRPLAAWLALAADYVTDLGISIAGSYVFLLTIVEAKLVFV